MIPDLYNRELKFGEIFKTSWGIFFRNFKYLFLFGLLLGIFLECLDLLLISVPAIASDTFLAQHLTGMISSVFGFICCIVAISITEQSVAAQQISWGYLFRRIKTFFWAALVIHVIKTLFNSLTWVSGFAYQTSQHQSVLMYISQAFLAFVVMIFSIYFYFTCQALVLCGKTGLSAFDYSFQSVRGHWWKTFRTAVLFLLMIAVPIEVSKGAEWSYLQMLVGAFWPSIMGTYVSIYFTILFLNITREELKEKVDDLRHPVDPLILSEKL